MPPLRLEVFEASRLQEQKTVVTDLNAMEEARLASYEQGYTAGWEDAVAAQTEEKSQIAVELAHNLQTLSFTYHEARVHILRSLEPLLIDLVLQLLPEIAKNALAPTVLEALIPLAECASSSPIRVIFNPLARNAIEPLIDHLNGPPLILVEEPTLGEGQVFLQLGESEVQVDIDGALKKINAALKDFLTLATKDQNNG